MGNLEVTTNTGNKHEGRGASGHGYPHFLWHATFEPALAPDISSVTLSGTTDTAAINALIQLPHWPPARYDAPTRAVTTAPALATLRLDRAGRPLPDRVVALSADLGLIAGVRRALTSLYCWPSWFLMTLEAAGDQLSVMPRAVHKESWDIEDDRGNHYAGGWIGGWSGQDNGAHIAFTPQLDPQARELRVSFTDPFGRAGRLTTVVAVPDGEQRG